MREARGPCRRSRCQWRGLGPAAYRRSPGRSGSSLARPRARRRPAVPPQSGGRRAQGPRRRDRPKRARFLCPSRPMIVALTWPVSLGCAGEPAYREGARGSTAVLRSRLSARRSRCSLLPERALWHRIGCGLECREIGFPRTGEDRGSARGGRLPVTVRGASSFREERAPEDERSSMTHDRLPQAECDLRRSRTARGCASTPRGRTPRRPASAALDRAFPGNGSSRSLNRTT